MPLAGPQQEPDFHGPPLLSSASSSGLLAESAMDGSRAGVSGPAWI